MSAKYRIGSLVEFNKDKYTEEEGEYKPYNEKYFEGKQGYVMAISDTKVSTAQSIEQLAESGNAEYMYKIKVGLSDIDNVPESDIFNPNENLTAKVEERLRKKQEGKTFSDTEGRIGGSAKEKSAYRLLKGQVYGLSDLEGIETDEATAIELIKKDKVYPKVDIEAERGKGVSSGAVFLKVKLREAFAGEPPNKKEKRKVYVGYATYLATAMESVFSVKDFEDFRSQKTIGTGIREIIKILKPELIENIEDETAQKIKDKEYFQSKVDELALKIEALEKNFNENTDIGTQKEVDIINIKNSSRNYRNELYNIDVNALTDIEAEFVKSLGFSRQGSNYVAKQLFTEVFGKRFVNFLTLGSDPVRETIETAKDYEALSLPESLMMIEKESGYGLKRLEENKEKLVKVNTLRGKQDYDEFFKGSEGDTGFSGGDFWKWQLKGKKYFYYKDLKGEEQVLAYKKRYISNLEERIKTDEKRIDAVKYKYRVRENNWEWAGAKKGKSTETDGKERSELKINTYPPLSFIKRTGGIKIEDSDITPVTIEKNGKKFATYPKIQEHFGFANVELGQSLLDREAKEHIRHFLGAMADFGDILNMNIVELNKLGGLSIAFASRGHGKASAHYEGLRKVINITKTRGGGAVAHEYMHYLDNIIPKINRAEYSFKEYASVIKEGRFGMRSAPVENKAVFKAIDNIFQYIYNRIMPSIDGDNRRTSEQRIVKVKKLINASDKSWQIPDSFYAKPKPENIEDYFEQFRERYSQYKRIENLKPKDISVLGAIVKKFGYKFYEFEFETRNSQYYANAIAMGSDYWSRAWELFARAFETYIFDKLDKLGRANNYLVSGDYFDRPEGIYPQGDERADLFLLYDALMQTIKTEYNISDFKAWTNERVDEYFDIENDKETGVIVDDKTKKPVKVVHDKKPSKKESKKVAVKEKLKAFLELLETEKMETGGNLQNNYGYTDKLNEFLLTLQN
jgi:hypothetical protein